MPVQAYSFADDDEPERQPSPEAPSAVKLACMCTSYDGGFWLASTKVRVAELKRRCECTCSGTSFQRHRCPERAHVTQSC